MPDADRDLYLRRAALLLVSQLPESVEDARMVLRYAREVVDGFLASEPRPAAPVRLAAVTPFPGRPVAVPSDLSQGAPT